MATRYFLPQDCTNGFHNFLNRRLRRMRPPPPFPINIQIQTQSGCNALPMRLLSDCDRLMQQAYILWNGDCVLCCVDWERTTVMGNVAPAGLQSVWQNENYLRFRRNYLAENVKGTICDGCMVQDEVDFSYKPKRSLAEKVLGKR